LRFIREARAPGTIGLTADESEKTNFKISNVRADSPAAEAGLQVEDVITSFGGNQITSANFLKVLARYKPGDKVRDAVARRTYDYDHSHPGPAAGV